MMKKESKSLKKISPVDSLLRDLRELIAGAREEAAQAVNSRLVILYWSMGRRIRQDILKGKRAEYGEEILHALSAKLIPEFGEGFSARNLSRMIKFAEAFPDAEIVSTLSRQLGWGPFHRDNYASRSVTARFLHRDVPHRAMEHTRSRKENSRDALRAHCAFEKA
jgi:hypothetical protein